MLLDPSYGTNINLAFTNTINGLHQEGFITTEQLEELNASYSLVIFRRGWISRKLGEVLGLFRSGKSSKDYHVSLVRFVTTENDS